eukprot:gene1254-1329_t
MTALSLSGLPDPLLQLLFSYLDDYDQRVFFVLSNQFLQLEKDISIIDMNMANLMSRGLNSKRLLTIRNGYDRLDLHFIAALVKQSQVHIIRSYEKRTKEEVRKGRQVPPPSNERLTDTVMEMWSFTSLRTLSTDLKGILTLLERNKLEKLQILSVVLETEDDDDENLEKLFDILDERDRCNSLQLKRLEIGNYSLDDDDDDELKPHLPSFDGFTGLRYLHLTGMVISQNPGNGFQSLNALKLDSCIVECDVSDFDGVERLNLEDCKGCNEISVFKITRNVHISSRLRKGDIFYTASSLDLRISENFKNTIHLEKYENARSFSLGIHYGTKNSLATLLMPEKLSNKLKEFRIEGLELFSTPLPFNNLRLVEFSGIGLSDVILRSLANINTVILRNCGEISFQPLASGIKNITIEYCSIRGSSPLQYCEKVTIIDCWIDHTLNLSDVKELTMKDCKFDNTEASNGGLIPLISNCQKLEVLKIDSKYLKLHGIILSEFPSLKKIVLSLLRGENWKMDNFPTSNFQVCLMPKDSVNPACITYLSSR